MVIGGDRREAEGGREELSWEGVETKLSWNERRDGSLAEVLLHGAKKLSPRSGSLSDVDGRRGLCTLRGKTRGFASRGTFSRPVALAQKNVGSDPALDAARGGQAKKQRASAEKTDAAEPRNSTTRRLFPPRRSFPDAASEAS